MERLNEAGLVNSQSNNSSRSLVSGNTASADPLVVTLIVTCVFAVIFVGVLCFYFLRARLSGVATIRVRLPPAKPAACRDFFSKPRAPAVFERELAIKFSDAAPISFWQRPMQPSTVEFCPVTRY